MSDQILFGGAHHEDLDDYEDVDQEFTEKYVISKYLQNPEPITAAAGSSLVGLPPRATITSPQSTLNQTPVSQEEVPTPSVQLRADGSQAGASEGDQSQGRQSRRVGLARGAQVGTSLSRGGKSGADSAEEGGTGGHRHWILQHPWSKLKDPSGTRSFGWGPGYALLCPPKTCCNYTPDLVGCQHAFLILMGCTFASSALQGVLAC